jgi:hypothetical protein
MTPIELSPSLGGADPLPVRRPIARAAVPLALDEGLEQHGPHAVAPLEVHHHAPSRHRQYARGEVGHVHPGQDQEAGVVENARQMLLPPLAIPADPAVARRKLPGRGAEAQTPQHFPLGAD